MIGLAGFSLAACKVFHSPLSWHRGKENNFHGLLQLFFSQLTCDVFLPPFCHRTRE